MLVKDIIAKLNEHNDRSAWNKGVALYAIELIAELPENMDIAAGAVEKIALNGAESWSEYSWGGCSLIYDMDIAERLCNPSELKKRRGGELKPNRCEDWLDVQARALFQAAQRLKGIIRGA